MGKEAFDLIVVGAGPGGYVAAERAARLGMRVACVERNERPGGVCLNVGCIPSKALLDSSEHYWQAGNRLAEHGLRFSDLGLDLSALMKRKERVVEGLTQSVRKLLASAGVEVIRGTARLAGPNALQVTRADGGEPVPLEAKTILLATGSEPVELPGAPFDGTRIVSSTEALSFESVPDRLVVVGAGYIGLELGSVWARLGAKVTVIEVLPRIAPGLDGQIARSLMRALQKQGLDFRVKTRLTGTEIRDGGVSVRIESESGTEELSCDRLLVAVGRRPLTRGLGIEEAGVRLDGSGRIQVDARYRTSVDGVFAIGDLVPGPMLAHKASAEGIAAVEGLAGLAGEVNYDAIPSAIYTWPEAASVGLTEEQAKERGLRPKTGAFPFGGNARARCLGETEGLAKVISHPRTDRILGVHILGPRASELIAECVLAVELGASAEDLARTVHGHPTFGEAVQDAARAAMTRGPEDHDP